MTADGRDKGRWAGLLLLGAEAWDARRKRVHFPPCAVVRAWGGPGPYTASAVARSLKSSHSASTSLEVVSSAPMEMRMSWVPFTSAGVT